MSPKRTELGSLELQILGLLDPMEGQSVTKIQAKLKARGSDLAYTTVMTVLSRLFKKGHLKRTKESRQFLYRLAPEKEKARLGVFDRVRDALFRGSRLNPILAMLNPDEPGE